MLQEQFFLNQKKKRMNTNFLFLIFSLFMLHEILALNHDWDRHLNDQIMFINDIKARLRELSIPELHNMIKRVEAFELVKNLLEKRQNLLREEEKMKKKEEEEMRQTKYKAFIESHFGSSSYLHDFFANRI
jgi:superoxide dismutase